MVKLQLVTENGLESFLIRWFTMSPVSHVDLVLPDGSLLGARLQGGVRIRPANYAKFMHTISVEVDCPNSEAVYEYAMAQVGKRYDWLAIINFVTQRNWRNASAWFCSELVAASFEKAGYPLLNPNYLPYRVTPGDLLKSPLTNYSVQQVKAIL